jgi:hypothetical protein
MTAKRKITVKGVLSEEIKNLMTPKAVEELKDLSPTMQQFLLRWQDNRDLILGDQLKNELKDFLLGIYEKDNDKLCENVVEVIQQELKPINDTLSDLKRGQDNIIITLNAMDGRLRAIESQVFITDEERLVKLEKYASIGNTILRGLAYIMMAIILSILAFFQLHTKMK